MGVGMIASAMLTPARVAVLRSRLPNETPSLTVDRACCSGMTAVGLGFKDIKVGAAETAICGGFESLSQTPLLMPRNRERALGELVLDDPLLLRAPDFIGGSISSYTAEEALKHGVDREAQDAWAVESHRRYFAADSAGYFDFERLPITVPNGKSGDHVVDKDESPRRDTSLEKLAQLKTVRGNKTITPGNAPGLNDGAAALVLLSEKKAHALSLPILARIRGYAQVAEGPTSGSYTPAIAIEKLLKHTELTADQLDLIEINEAFAATVLVSTLRLAGKDTAAAEKLARARQSARWRRRHRPSARRQWRAAGDDADQRLAPSRRRPRRGSDLRRLRAGRQHYRRRAGLNPMEPAELRRIARTISTVENRANGYEAILAQAYRLPRWADVIGITGPPGAGKSTLVDALTAYWAEAGERVAILAIDPSSPYSGGAVLGDRIRRTRSGGYTNTYFRSLSSRGHVGGLSETATDLIAALSLFEFRRIIVETVGAGQSDVEIHETADCTVVVTVPGLGDGVQASKAGLMEIGDVFAVNKADMPGAKSAARTVEDALAAAYMGEPGINRPDRRSVAASRAPSAMPGLIALRRRHGDYASDESGVGSAGASGDGDRKQGRDRSRPRDRCVPGLERAHQPPRRAQPRARLRANYPCADCPASRALCAGIGRGAVARRRQGLGRQNCRG